MLFRSAQKYNSEHLPTSTSRASPTSRASLTFRASPTSRASPTDSAPKGPAHFLQFQLMQQTRCGLAHFLGLQLMRRSWEPRSPNRPPCSQGKIQEVHKFRVWLLGCLRCVSIQGIMPVDKQSCSLPACFSCIQAMRQTAGSCSFSGAPGDAACWPLIQFDSTVS